MKRDHLDDAIDAVAARLTHVTEDDGLALRMINQLPERTTWLSWLFHSWTPRLAVAVLAFGIALVVLQPFSDRSLHTTVVSSPTVPLVARAAVPEHRTDAKPPQVVRRTTVERSSNDLRTIDARDFERSLPAIAAVRSLEFDSLAPVSLPEDASLTLEPLAIADLPLTTESIPPR